MQWLENRGATQSFSCRHVLAICEPIASTEPSTSTMSLVAFPAKGVANHQVIRPSPHHASLNILRLLLGRLSGVPSILRHLRHHEKVKQAFSVLI